MNKINEDFTVTRFTKILIAVGVVLVLCLAAAKELSHAHKQGNSAAIELMDADEFLKQVNKEPINRK